MPIANENHAHGYYDDNSGVNTLCTCGWDNCHPETVNFKLSASTHIRMANAAARKHNTELALELIAVLNEGYQPNPNHWLNYAAAHFAGLHHGSDRDRAVAVLRYFETTSYQPTTSARAIRSIILRAAS